MERLGHRVIRTRADPAHRLADPQPPTGGLEGRGSVLPAVVGMEYRPGQRAPRPGRVFQGVFDEAGAHVVGDRPADQTPGAHVDDGGQIEELPLPTGQVGDVADVDLIRCLSPELAFEEVVDNACALVLDRGLLRFT